jgi:hypothetical protein
MRNRKFSIFKVYDYKGGELSSLINLQEESFYEELAELFENHEFLEDDLDKMSEDLICEELEKIISSRDFSSMYASNETTFTGEIYEHIDNDLVKVSIKNFIPQIAEHIKKNW